jgi:prepilin-type N-terminal cleavage/methylation domain-containing protein
MFAYDQQQRNQTQPKSELGFSLLEVIVAVGLASVVATSAVTMYFNKGRTLEKAKAAGEKTDLRAYLRQSINCSNTISSPDCSSEAI